MPLATDPIFVGVLIGTRFLLPLFIPIFPLPAILACLVVDAWDQSILALFTHVDPVTYQAYDKALDIFYLSIAAFAVLRAADGIGRPLGTPEFVADLERRLGRRIGRRAPGRKPVTSADEDEDLFS